MRSEKEIKERINEIEKELFEPELMGSLSIIVRKGYTDALRWVLGDD